MRLFLYLIKKANRTPVTQELYLDEKTMPHVYVIVSRMYGSYTRSYLLMRKQCLNVYVIVNRIYGSYTRLFLNEKTMRHVYVIVNASTAVTQGVIS